MKRGGRWAGNWWGLLVAACGVFLIITSSLGARLYRWEYITAQAVCVILGCLVWSYSRRTR